MNWASRYVGIPFLSDGLDRNGLHCWGLVRLVLAEQCGIDVPTYGEHSAADLIAAARRMGAPDEKIWTRVTPPATFDVVLMTAMDRDHGRLVAHAGIMTDATHVLHVWKATHAVCMPTDHPRVRQRIIGYYRHRSLL